MKTIVEIPHLPAPALNPNTTRIKDEKNPKKYRAIHWNDKRVAKKDAREEMYYALKNNDNPVFIPDKPYESAILKIEFVAGFRDRQRKNRDIDNLLASAKPYIDGLVDGGVIVDDTAVRLRYELVYRFGEEAKMVFTVTKKRRQF